MPNYSREDIYFWEKLSILFIEIFGKARLYYDLNLKKKNSEKKFEKFSKNSYYNRGDLKTHECSYGVSLWNDSVDDGCIPQLGCNISAL